jgi:hypothetical protein
MQLFEMYSLFKRISSYIQIQRANQTFRRSLMVKPDLVPKKGIQLLTPNRLWAS